MTKRSRYLLLLIGFLIFLVGAPAIVLYVRGMVYDQDTGRFIKTGIFAVRLEPRDADILVDGEVKRENSGDVKFLRPGDYTFTVRQEGFFDWSKRLPIRANEVTWGNFGYEKIFLFLQKPESQQLAGNVSDFFVRDNLVLYASGNNLVITSLDRPDKSDNLALSEPAVGIIPTLHEEYFLIRSKNAVSVLDLKAKKITRVDLSPQSAAEISPRGNLYVLESGILSQVVWKVGQKTPLLSGVSAFSIFDDTLYLVRSENGATVLTAANISSLEEQVIAQNIPAFSTIRLFVNYDKHVMLLGDSALYKVNNTLERVAESVAAVQDTPGTIGLAVLHAGELSSYYPDQGRLNLITRSSLPMYQPVLKDNINYVFYLRDGKLTASELDTRDHQNEYTLYSGTDIQKFQIDAGGRYIFILDSGTLTSLKVR